MSRAGTASVPRPEGRPRPVLIEFVGLPGAGKTAIADRVLDTLERRGRTCRGRRQPARGLGAAIAYRARREWYHLRHGRALRAALRFGLSVRPLRAANLWHASRLAHWAYRLRLAADAGWEVIVLDQGVVQQAWSAVVAGRRWDAHAARQALAAVLAADLSFAYVFLEVDIDTAVARVRARPSQRSRFDRMDECARRDLMDRHRADLQSMFRSAVAATAAPWCVVDTTAPVDATSRVILDFIASLDGLNGAA